MPARTTDPALCRIQLPPSSNFVAYATKFQTGSGREEACQFLDYAQGKARRQEGYVVYGVASDREDNGGKEKQPGDKSEDGYDLTFTVGR